MTLWGDARRFVERFSPPNQIKLAGNEGKSLMADTPCVANVAMAYGFEVMTRWLATHFIELNEYCGVREKMGVAQIDQMSRILLTRYGYLKPQEFMLFFLKFKGGEFGQLYGVIDPIVIGNAFTKFIGWRAGVIDKANAERERMERAERDETLKKMRITYEEWLMRKNAK